MISSSTRRWALIKNSDYDQKLQRQGYVHATLIHLNNPVSFSQHLKCDKTANNSKLLGSSTVSKNNAKNT